VAGDRIVNVQSFARSLLRLRLALARFGAGPLLAGALLLAAALLWLGLVPGMSARVDDETRSVARLRAMPVPKPVVPAPVLAAARLADFYDRLGDSAHTGEIVTHLFEAAAAAGVTLDKAEYKPGHDTPGRFDTYTIVLPVKGDYARLRQFSEKVLVAVPYAALDDMRFKRNSANDPGVEANLRFTAFLRPVTIAPISASEVAAAEAAASAAGASAAAAVSAAAGAVGPGAASGPVPVPAVASAPRAASVTNSALPVTFSPTTAVATVTAEVPLPTTNSMPAGAPDRTRGAAARALPARATTGGVPSAAPSHGAGRVGTSSRAATPALPTVPMPGLGVAMSAVATPAHTTTAPSLVTIATIPARAASPALPIIAVPVHGAAAPLTFAPKSAADPGAAGIATPVAIAPPPAAVPAKPESIVAAGRAPVAASSPAPGVPASAPVAPAAPGGASAPTAGLKPPAASAESEGAAP
jgi:hypothetical protein